MSAFARNTLTSVFTTALDFGANYVIATFVGTVIGATSNFLINRAWSFKAAAHAPLHHQALRMLPVQVGSSGLQTLGVWLFTRFAGLPYVASKLVVAVLVYLGWNYPLNRYFVFRPPPATASASPAGRADTSTASTPAG